MKNNKSKISTLAIYPGSGRFINLFSITISLVVLFTIIWLVFITGNLTPDNKVFEIITPCIKPEMTHFLKMVTFLGNYKFLITANVLVIVVLCILKKRSR